MKPIKEYKIKSSLQAAYIPILDAEPSFAAKFLTKKDLVKAYKLLTETFKEINNNEPYHLLLYDTILYSGYNFTWFVNFFREIENILRKEPMYIDLTKCPIQLEEKLEVYQPYYAESRSKENFSLQTPRTNVKTQSPINNYRMRYIMAQYDLSEFQDDQFPGWYLLSETTIFEQYNEKTNTRVKIEFRDGRFYYFIAGASDNWQFIDAPKEMDHVVSALIFRNVLD